MTDSAPASASGGRWGRVFLLTMALGWSVWAVLAWWAAPRESDVGQLGRDVAAGRVVTVQRGDGWQRPGAFWGTTPNLRPGPRGPTLAWSLPDGRIRYADVGVPLGDPEPTPDGTDGRLARVAEAWPSTSAPAHRIAAAAEVLAAAVTLGWLAMLVVGPDPVVGTRWFWFWLGSLPFGLGVLAWLHRERWRPSRRHGSTPPAVARRSGWVGLGWSLLATVGLSLAVVALRGLLGGALVPG
ncbi:MULTISPECIES: hypothetical protein [unclassified Micromonospora]|uniref:hypothetical protein n=1 Tax=unclassified Micromonospora TaxID=2617518 RepID=UPI00118352DD|nr:MULTISPECIES: hypothetical protein [unclassified Micromonospora]